MHTVRGTALEGCEYAVAMRGEAEALGLVVSFARPKEIGPGANARVRVRVRLCCVCACVCVACACVRVR